MEGTRKKASSPLEIENRELRERVEALSDLLDALKQRKESVAIQNEALKLRVESEELRNEALRKEIEPLKQIDEQLKARNEQLSNENEALKASVESLKSIDDQLTARIDEMNTRDEAKKRIDDELRVRNEQIKKSGEFAEFVKMKASEVKRVRVNGKAITDRLILVLFEIAERGSAHVHEMCEKLRIPRPTMTRGLRFLRKMGWIRLQGSYKFGAYVLTDEGKSVIESWKVKP